MSHDTPSKPPRTRDAATDVAEFVTDLDGGVFDIALSTALSKVAAAVIDHDKKGGKVKIEFDFERIAGTYQVRIGHKLTFTHPTSLGKSSEEMKGATVLHVGKYGALSLAQQPLIGKQGELPHVEK